MLLRMKGEDEEKDGDSVMLPRVVKSKLQALLFVPGLFASSAFQVARTHTCFTVSGDQV